VLLYLQIFFERQEISDDFTHFLIKVPGEKELAKLIALCILECIPISGCKLQSYLLPL